MSTDHDTTRIVRSWLEEGPTRLPDRVLDHVVDRLPATHQRRAWWPARRFRDMNNILRFGLAAAVVVVLALVGLGLSRGTPQVVAPGPTAPPSVLATPPAASPSPSPVLMPNGALPAGRYVLTPFAKPGSDACMASQPGCIDPTDDDALRVTLAVPDGWSGSLGDGVALTGAPGAQPEAASLIIVRGASLYEDPCRTAQTTSDFPEIPVGPTVADFVDALVDHPLLEVTAPADVTLDGYRGKYLELQVPQDLTRCGIYLPWEPWYYAQGPGERWHLWVLDVDGVRVVVQSVDHAGTSAEHRAELQAIVDSIQFTN